MDIKQKMQDQFDARKKQVGEYPATKDRQELQAMELQANQILENMRGRSQARLQEVRGALVQQLRLNFSESIQGVAKSHQMKVVLTSPSDAVIFSVATVDITAELIETLRPSSASIKLEPPAPAQGLPTSRLSVPPTMATVAPTGSAAPASPRTPAPAPPATPAPKPATNTTGESK